MKSQIKGKVIKGKVSLKLVALSIVPSTGTACWDCILHVHVGGRSWYIATEDGLFDGFDQNL